MTALTSRMIELARSCVGTKFHHHGRVPHAGMDCAGLLIWTLRSVGVHVDDEPYGLSPDPVLLSKKMEACLTPTTVMRPGTFALIWIGTPSNTTHCGLIAEHTIIHALQVYGVCEHSLVSPWTDRISRMFSLPKESEWQL